MPTHRKETKAAPSAASSSFQLAKMEKLKDHDRDFVDENRMYLLPLVPLPVVAAVEASALSAAAAPFCSAPANQLISNNNEQLTTNHWLIICCC